MLKPFVEVDLGTFPIYAAMVLLGGIVALMMLNSSLKKEGYSLFMRKRVRRSFFWAALAGLLCANLGNWFLYEGMLDLSIYTRLTQGGLTFLFGLIPFLLISALLLRLHKIEVMKTMDLVVAPLLIAHFLGRVGCSLRGCCWGATVVIGGEAVMLPVRELEGLLLLTMGILIPKIKKKRLWVYLFAYSVLRFILEFFRGDNRGCLFGITALSPSQILCIGLFVVSGIMLIFEPLIRTLKLEEKWGALKEKLRIKRKDGSVYIPHPVNYEVLKKPHPVCTVFRVIAVILVLAILFVAINPFKLNWCYDMQAQMENWFSFLHVANGTQQVIGDSNGTDILPLYETYYEPIDWESGLKIVSMYDDWSGAQFAPATKEPIELESGGKIYTYWQVIEDKPVLGTNHLLLTDKDSRPICLLSDPASLAYTNNKIENYLTNGSTLKQLYGASVKVTKKLDCWYDTGRGLLEAEHVYFQVGKGGEAGAVLQKSDSAVICLTKAELGALPVGDRGALISQIDTCLGDLRDSASTVATSAATAADVTLLANSAAMTNADAERMVEMAIEELVRRVENMSDAQCIAVLGSVRNVLSISPTANPKLFCQVFAQQTELVMANMGFTAEQIREVSTGLEAFLKQFYPAQYDEAAVEINAQERESTFSFGFQYTMDADMYRVISQEEHSLSLTVTTQLPALVEIYDVDGRAVTGMFVETSETFTMYPEDGTVFFVRVKLPEFASSGLPAEYQITTKTERQAVDVPIAVRTAITRVEMAYNTSDAVSFAAMYKYKDQSMTENMGTAMLLPAMDACAGVMTQNTEIDLAKAVILEAMLQQPLTEDAGTRLRDSQMTLSYVWHVEQTDAYVVMINIRVTQNELLVCNSRCLFRLQPLNDGDLPIEIEEAIGFMGYMNANYCITESNTDNLLAEFGLTRDDMAGCSDLASLYRYCTDEEVMVDDELSVRQITFDKNMAKKYGHSDKKIDAYEVYIARQNKSVLRMAYLDALSKASTYRMVTTIYDVYDFVSDPIGAYVDSWDNEWASETYAVISSASPEKYVEDKLTDAYVEPIIDMYRAKAEKMEKRCVILGEMLAECEQIIHG